MSSGVVQEKVTSALIGALNGAKKKGQLKTEAWPQVSLDTPKRPEWGDLASTVAMSLAASEQRAPHDIAQIIIDNLSQRDQLFDRVEIVRPGFLNLTVKPVIWQEVLREIERQGSAYGRAEIGAAASRVGGICECESDRSVACGTWAWRGGRAGGREYAQGGRV